MGPFGRWAPFAHPPGTQPPWGGPPCSPPPQNKSLSQQQKLREPQAEIGEEIMRINTTKAFLGAVAAGAALPFFTHPPKLRSLGGSLARGGHLQGHPGWGGEGDKPPKIRDGGGGGVEASSPVRGGPHPMRGVNPTRSSTDRPRPGLSKGRRPGGATPEGGPRFPHPLQARPGRRNPPRRRVTVREGYSLTTSVSIRLLPGLGEDMVAAAAPGAPGGLSAPPTGDAGHRRGTGGPPGSESLGPPPAAAVAAVVAAVAAAAASCGAAGAAARAPLRSPLPEPLSGPLTSLAVTSPPRSAAIG